MRVTGVDILASNPSNFIELSFKDPTSQNPFNVKAILGLDANEITPQFYGDSGVFNQRYYELSMQKRDIVVQVTLNPDYAQGQTVSTLRDELYRLISSSRTGSVTLQFKDGETIVAVISGFVTKFEAVQFSKLPEVQFTINCPDAMLKASTEINVPIGDSPISMRIIDNLSTAPHGFRFGLKFTYSGGFYITEFSIQDSLSPTWAFELSLTGSPLDAFFNGDELHFSSEKNNRYLYLVRGLDIIHLVDRIIPTSVWPILFPGENDLLLSTGFEWDYVTHYPTYWGV